ncbi:MAG: helix-turn-helix domain-containing protein [Aestuariibacter sp.]
MAIIITLDVMLAKRKMKLNTLSELVGIAPQNLSAIKTEKARAIRLETLDRLCQALQCTPADLLTYQPSESDYIRPE